MKDKKQELLQSVFLPIEKLENNTGQLEGIPANPRKITDADVKQLRKSIEETPEMLNARELLVVPNGDTWVAIGGNQRLRALRALGYEQAVCKIIPENYDRLAIAIKDNTEAGEWDNEMLEQDWDKEKLADWGVRLPEKKETDRLSDGKFNTIYYKPKEDEILDIAQCVDTTLFDKKKQIIEESELSEEKKRALMIFAYRFLRIDFERVANYYAYKASEEEKKVIERLRLVLVDNGGGGADDATNGFVEDELLKIADVFNKANEDE